MGKTVCKFITFLIMLTVIVITPSFTAHADAQTTCSVSYYYVSADNPAGLPSNTKGTLSGTTWKITPAVLSKTQYVTVNGSKTITYTFSGWFTNANCVGTKYFPGKETTQIKPTSSNGKYTVKLYGKWVKTEKVNKESQKINISAKSYVRNYEAEPFNLNATASTKISYKSSNTKVCTVDKNGLVTLKGVGSASITVVASETTKYAADAVKVNVIVKKARQRITNLKESYDLKLSATKDISPKAMTALSYESSNPVVATIDSNGKIVAKSVGTATITVTAAPGANHESATAQCLVNVTKMKTQSIKSISKYTFSKPGLTKSIKAKATSKLKVKYSSANPKIVSVNSSGVMKAKKEGKTTITVTQAGNSNFYPAKKKIKVKVLKDENDDYVPSTGKMGEATYNEHKKTSGGSPGDQTGSEVSKKNFTYSSSAAYHRWQYVIRCKDPQIQNKAAQEMEYACANHCIGYDYDSSASPKLRDVLSGMKTKTMKPGVLTRNCETRCTDVVVQSYRCAGVYVGVCASAGIKNKCTNTGKFKVLYDKKYRTSTKHLMRGDILVSPGHHTAMVL